MQDTLKILKIGGKLLAEKDQLEQVLRHFIQLEDPKILVHGGGKKATEVLRQMEIPPKMVNGRRITDAPTLEVVVMIYAGLVNKQMVSLMQSLGGNAFGMSGADGNLIQAHKRTVNKIDYGFAGDIDQVNVRLIKNILQLDLIPVFCAITHDQKGQLLNTNADTIAATLATALANDFLVELIYCFEKNGVLENPEDDTSVIPILDHQAFQKGIINGQIFEGMIPKLDNAFGALKQGVNKVLVCGVESWLAGGGTVLS